MKPMSTSAGSTMRDYAAIAAILIASSTALAQSKTLGFSLQVSTNGIFSPKVVKAVVGQVQEGSQAMAAGLRVGDELIRVEGIDVPGNEAMSLKPHMEFIPGKPKRMTFKRTGGSKYEVALTKAQ